MGLEPLTCWEPPPEGAAGLPTVLEPAEELEASLDSSTKVKSLELGLFLHAYCSGKPLQRTSQGEFPNVILWS